MIVKNKIPTPNIDASKTQKAKPTATDIQRKKIIFIVLGIIGFFLIAGLVATGVALFAVKKTLDNANIKVDSNGVTLKDQSTGENVTFGKSDNGTYTYNSKDGSVVAGQKTIPADFPQNVPMYPGYTIDSISTVKDNKTGKNGYIASLITKDDYQKVVNYYDSNISAKGWNVTNSFKDSTSNTSTYYAERDNLGLIVTVTKETDKITISIIVGDQSEFTNSGDTTTPDNSGQ